MTGQRAKLSLCMGGCFFFFLSGYLYLVIPHVSVRERPGWERRGKGKGKWKPYGLIRTGVWGGFWSVILCFFVFFLMPIDGRIKKKCEVGGLLFSFFTFRLVE